MAEDVEPYVFIESLAKNRTLYDGYNVLVGNSHQLFHYNNILGEINEITAGTHSLSNHTLDTPWPKVIKGKKALGDYVQNHPTNIRIHPLFDIVADRTIAEDEVLPNTGVGLEMERWLSPLFIKMPNYGTRSSTVVLIDKEDNVTFAERVYLEGELQQENQFTFKIEEKNVI